MIRPFPIISIQQITSFYLKGKEVKRDKIFDIDFVHEYEVESGWESHTDRLKITLPKNVILKTEEFMFQQSGTYNVILGPSKNNTDYEGNDIIHPPLIMKGDIVTLSHGYRFKNEQGEDVIEAVTIFNGYVSNVESSIPIKIEVEDNFYLLKRTPVNVRVWGKELVSLCEHMIQQVNDNFGNKNINYPILSLSKNIDSLTANFSLGHLDIGEMSCSELLSRLRSQYKLESFFVGNELRFGFPIYNESEANNKNVFEFEENIIGDNLEYKSKDDIVLSAIVNCVSIAKTGKKTQDGAEATKRSKLSILVYWDLSSQSFKFHSKKKNESFPKNEGGERRTFIYAINPNSPQPSEQTLFEYGKKQLEKYYYSGFKGSFETFGYPFVKWGDNITLLSKTIADRNGVYKVKKVVYRGGVGGIRQEIHLDYKIDIPLPKITKQIYLR